MFGQGINENVENTLREVLSSNDIEEHYLSTDCLSFNTIAEVPAKITKKNKSKFYIKKRNTIEFKDKDVTIPGEELFTEYVSSQAKIQKPVPDKNIDFTSELNQLIKTNDSKSDVKPYKELSKLLSKAGDEVADSKNLNRKTEKINKSFKQTQIKTFITYQKGNADYKGNGFEYNYVTGEYSSTSGSDTKGTNYVTSSNKKKNDCNVRNKECKKTTKTTKTVKEKKVKTVNSNFNIKMNIENSDNESFEINVNDDSENENQCN
jgi:hypothetical protein